MLDQLVDTTHDRSDALTQRLARVEGREQGREVLGERGGALAQCELDGRYRRRERWGASSMIASFAMTPALRRFATWTSLGVGACTAGEGDDPVTSSTDATTVPATSSTTATSTTPVDSSGSDPTTSEGSSSSTTGDTSTGSTTEPTIDAVAVYVSSDATLYRFAVDLDTGALTQLEAIDAGGELGPLTHDATRRWLFGGLTSDNAILTWQIADDGSLSVVGQQSVGVSPVYLSLVDAGPYLLSSDYGAAVLASHAIGADGLVVTPAAGWLDVQATPHAIVPTPDGSLAFVPHLGPERITAYRIDAATGALTAGLPETIAPPGSGPRHMVFSADGAIAWVANEVGDSITTWQVGEPEGTLVELQTLSTLPEGTSGNGNTCADVHVTPDGRFVYVSNRGHDTMAGFAVQPDGTLAFVSHTDTEPHVRDFGIDPTGSFLYAAGRDSGQLAGYVIGAGGELTAIGTVPVPPAPLWVEAVAL